MASRDIATLLPDVDLKVREWLARLHDRQVDPLVYCTWRSPDEQDTLYARGRSLVGPRVTNARAWESWHQCRRAWDAVPLRSGRPVWGYSPYDEDWEAMVEEADRLGIEWGGRWHRFPDYAHWQVVPAGLTLVAAKRETLDYEERSFVV